MGSIQILLGRSRWRRRAALAQKVLSGVDPFGRPTALVVTTSARKRRDIERSFVEFRRDRPVFAPDVRVWSQLVDGWWERHGDGRAILSPRSESMIAEQVLQDAADRWPRLAALGTPVAVADALAALRNTFASSLLPALPETWQPEVREAVAALERRLAGASGFVSRTTALRRLHHILAGTPPRAWVQQLRSSPSVVLDDFLDTTRLDLALLIAACRAWSDAGSHVVLSLETGKDLGGAEVASFFGVEEEGVASWLRPFRAVRSLRTAIFESFIAEGAATLLLARRDGVVEVEPHHEPTPPQPADLADWLFESAPLPIRSASDVAAVSAKVRVTRYRDSLAEIRGVAAQVQEALRAGIPASQLAVAVPEPARVGGRWRHVFAEHGVRAAPDPAGKLADWPLAALVLDVARLAVDGWERDVLLHIFGSDFVDHGAGTRVDVGALGRQLASAGAPAGPPATWPTALSAWARATGRPMRDYTLEIARLDVLAAPLAALARRATPARWRERLLAALVHLGVPTRVESMGEDALLTWGALQACLDGLVLDLRAAFDGEIEPEALVRHLRAALRRAPGPEEGGRDGAVPIIPIQDLRGLTPRRAWVAGLVRGAYPRPPRVSFLTPGDPQEDSADLGDPDPAVEDRWLFASLLRNVLDDREMEFVAFSYPAVVDGREAARSPLLAELLDATTQVVEGGRPKKLSDLLDLAPADPGPVSPTRLLEALARQGGRPDEAGRVSDDVRQQLDEQAARYADREGDRPGPWTGRLSRVGEHAPGTLSVTALETYLTCPARYWYQKALSLDPARPASVDVPPDVRGELMHRIVAEFLRGRLGAPVAGEWSTLAAELHGIATRELSQIADRFVPALVAALTDEWLAGLVDRRPLGVLAAWLKGELASRCVPEQVEQNGEIPLGPGKLVARLDRVDRTAEGRLVIDYKTGQSPRREKVAQGLALQPIAYAKIVQERSGGPVASTFIELRQAREVKRRGWVGDPVILDAFQVPQHARLDRSPQGIAAHMEHAASAFERLHRGVFHTTLAKAELAGCRSCAFRHVCDTSPARAARHLASDADAQRPMGGEA